MAPSTVFEVQEQMVQAYIGQRYEQYVSTVLACWFLWDHVITLDQEVRLIWRSPSWTLIKILFILIRYGISITYSLNLYNVFARAGTPGICTYSLVFVAIFYAISQLVQIVLCLRVWALYNCCHWTGAFLGFLYLGTVITSLQTLIKYIMSAPISIPPMAPGTPQLFGCPIAPITGYYAGLVAAMILETIIVAMTIWKVCIHIYQDRKIPFLDYLISTGVVYYIVMLTVLLLNVLTKPVPVLEIPILSSSCIIVVQGVSCCRIVLGLLRYAQKSEQYAASGAGTKPGTTSDSANFFTIPTGIYDKDVLEELEYGLSVQEVNDLIASQSIDLSLTAVDTASQEV